MFFKQRFQKFKEHKLELWKWQSIPILTLQGCEKNLSDLADMLTAYLHQGGGHQIMSPTSAVESRGACSTPSTSAFYTAALITTCSPSRF